MTSREKQIWNKAIDACIKKAGVVRVKKPDGFGESFTYEVNIEQLKKLKK